MMGYLKKETGNAVFRQTPYEDNASTIEVKFFFYKNEQVKVWH